MRCGVIARKLGMSRIFNDKGEHVPVTILRLEDVEVLSTRSIEKDGYIAVQLGFNNKKLKNIIVLQGGEVNIKDDGSLDMKNSVLRELDIVLAAIHSGFKNPREKITRRMVTAMENEHVDIIAHPSGRLINQRPAIELELDKILSKAKNINVKTCFSLDKPLKFGDYLF